MTVECDILFHARLHWVCVCRHYTKAAESRFHIFTLTLSLREREPQASDCCLADGRWATSGTGVIQRRWTNLSLPTLPLPSPLTPLPSDGRAEPEGEGRLPAAPAAAQAGAEGEPSVTHLTVQSV